jgi:hypothetical protein
VLHIPIRGDREAKVGNFYAGSVTAVASFKSVFIQVLSRFAPHNHN